MYKIFFIQIVFLLQIQVEILAENKTETIQKLEKEKGKLFQNINSAIDESVRVLKNENDSDAALGVTYMQKLKQQLKEINGTDFKDIEAANDTRRSDKLNMNIFDLASIFQKDKSQDKIKRDANNIVIKKKIDDWIVERETEKRKIQEYKERQKLSVKEEDCPRYGVGKKSGKKTRRNINEKPRAKKTLPKYPCCRKCCKSSYMGCL